MIISVSSDEDQKNYVKSFEEIRSQIEAEDVESMPIGVKRLKRLLKAYKNPENMEKHDFYLLQGIFEHDPEAKDYNVLINDNETARDNN